MSDMEVLGSRRGSVGVGKLTGATACVLYCDAGRHCLLFTVEQIAYLIRQEAALSEIYQAVNFEPGAVAYRSALENKVSKTQTLILCPDTWIIQEAEFVCFCAGMREGYSVQTIL